MRPDTLADPSAARDPSDDPGGAAPVQSAAIRGQEDRPVATLADGQVDRTGGAWCQRDGDDLAAPCG
jgi:hypothetical protein